MPNFICASILKKCGGLRIVGPGSLAELLICVSDGWICHTCVGRGVCENSGPADSRKGYFLTLSNSTRSVGVEDRKTMTAIRNRPQTAVERC